MSEFDYSHQLRELVTDYLDHRVSRVEYLALRRDLLDEVDRDFNGDETPSGWPASETARLPDENDSSPEEDTWVPKP